VIYISTTNWNWSWNMDQQAAGWEKITSKGSLHHK